MWYDCRMASLRSPRLQTAPSIAYLDSVGNVSVASAQNADGLWYDSAAGAWVAIAPTEIPVLGGTISLGHDTAQSFVPGAWNPIIWSGLSNNTPMSNADYAPNLASTVTASIDASQNGADLASATYLDVDDASSFEDPAGGANAIALVSVTISGRKWAVAYKGVSIGGGSGGSDRLTISTAGALGAGWRGQGTLTTGDTVTQEETRFYAPNTTVWSNLYDKTVLPLEPLTAGNVKLVRRRTVDFFLNLVNDVQSSPTSDVTNGETASWVGGGGFTSSGTTPDNFSVLEVYLPDVGATAGEVDAGGVAGALIPHAIYGVGYTTDDFVGP